MDQSFENISLPAGTLLFAERDAGSLAFLIVKGRIEIFLTRDGQDDVLAVRGPGEIVGEMAIIDKGPRSASARITEDCELTLISADQIAHRIAETDPILRMCLGVVIGRYRETVSHLNQGRVRTQAVSIEQGEFTAALKTLSIESELRRALRNNEFELFFQPIVQLPSRRLAGFEALLRWHHPQRGFVSPGEFIPIAEASGLIGDITQWCLSEVGHTFPAIMQAALGNVLATGPLFMTVNISGHDLINPHFLASVLAMTGRTGIAPGSLKLEITESVLMKDPAMAAGTLNACRVAGLGIAIDDFGTGYSSLSHLGSLPMTTIKIDQSFVRSMRQHPASRKIVNLILRLAEELAVPVVAEGIESEDDERLLAEAGCAFGQGYFFGKPAPLAETLDRIRTWLRPDKAPRIKTPFELKARSA